MVHGTSLIAPFVLFAATSRFGSCVGGGPPWVCETEEQLIAITEECAQIWMVPTLSDCLNANPNTELAKLCHCARTNNEATATPAADEVEQPIDNRLLLNRRNRRSNEEDREEFRSDPRTANVRTVG